MSQDIAGQFGMAGQLGAGISIEDAGPGSRGSGSSGPGSGGYEASASGSRGAGPTVSWRRLGMIGGFLGPFLLAGLAALPSFRHSHDHDSAYSSAADDHWMAPGVMMVGRPTTVSVTPVTSDALSHVPGKSVTVEIVEFQPGARAPEHHHAGSVTVYVLSGAVRSQLAGSPPMIYHTGQSFFEPPGAVHLFAENPSSTDVARIMAIHVADDGAQLTTFH
ncbi:cupin domain-containing protein [Dongia soli]|uniref:Cupin domain-containing protein n=1 Tax=Dongia soli TaxID=600628 RepID=A0ABU5EE75_9PROT|nr:cupin domain-containing protein [Dongia soli]MDY0884650.1 cupin domain-containing protein [Dongia soli]